MTNISFLERKKASLCILAGICALSLFVIINSGGRINENTGDAYVIRIKHYGVNAAEMERSITIPVEDALFSIPGIQTIQSSSENSLSNIFIRFKPAAGRFKTLNSRFTKPGTKGRYEAVRDAVQRIYETFPFSVQRPEIFNSNNSRVPVWSAAVIANDSFDTTHILEKVIKPRLESLEGTGEVLISGTGLKEIFITLDQEKISILGLEPQVIASYLGMNDSIFSGGINTFTNREIIVTVDGRYDKLDSAFIPLGDGNYIELSEIAFVTEQERDPDIYSRLNGKKTAGVAVMGRHGADLRKLSSDIKRELSDFSLPELRDNFEFIVLSDLGAEEKAAFRSVLNAALSGAIMVAVISFLLNRKNNLNIAGFFCAVSIPVICLISAAVLSISGFPADRLLLAGIAAGVGTAVDAVILCSEKLRKCTDLKTASLSLSRLKGPLLAGGATTVAALLPLSAIEEGGAGIIAVAISVVTITALVLSLTFLPPLLLWEIKNQKTCSPKNRLPKLIKQILKRLLRCLCRTLAAVVRFCTNCPVLVLAVCIAITVSAIFLLFARGVDTTGYGSEDSVYGQVEFDSGLLAEETDRLLAAYSEQLLRIPGIRNVETGARTGSGSLLISFDPGQTKAHLVRDSAKQIQIPGSFVFFHENSLNETFWEIIVYGDEDQKCREIAEELIYLCADHPLVLERVLNFKQGSSKLILLPDREIFAESKISFSAAAARVRLGVYGPVIYKRMNSGRETDVRIRTGSSVTQQTRNGIMDLLVSSGDDQMISYLRMDSLMLTKDDTEPSSIRRDNRRRSASITVSTKPMDPRRVREELARLFEKLDLPPGYSIEFDPEAIRQSENISATVLSLIMAVIFCYMIIASVNESFGIPLLVLSAVPPSLAIPGIFLVISGSAYNSAVACAFIAVSGMTVNAAILCVDGFRSRILTKKDKTPLNIYLALREKAPALLSTTGTTVAAAIPFLFLTEGMNTLIRTLSFVGALGIACSFFCSITVIPSLFSISKISLKPVLNKYVLLERNINLKGVKDV